MDHQTPTPSMGMPSSAGTHPSAPPPPGVPSTTNATPSNGTPTPPSAAPDAHIKSVETAFQRLLGRLPNEAERTRIYAVRDTLRLQETDAVWALFVALDHYLSLYERFPPLIRAAASEVLVEFKTDTDAQLKALVAHLENTARQLEDPLKAAAQSAVREAKEEFIAGTRQIAHQAARRARLEQFWPWLLGGGASIALALALSIGIALGYGRHQGYTEGYTEGLQQTPTSEPTPPQSRSQSRRR